jgi:hypothetical protein
MMRPQVAALLLATLASVSVPPRAEVSSEPGPDGVAVLILGIIEGPDPIPQVLWAPVREIEPWRILNADGAGRGDGRPDATVDPTSGGPIVVWAYNHGTDNDIAWSEWDRQGWTATEFLTSTAVNQLDPRVYVDEAGAQVVWWEEGTEQVWLARRRPGAAWDLPELVADHPGQRPSVVVWNGQVLVSTEKDNGPAGKTILLSKRQGPGEYTTEHIQAAPAGGPLDAILHTENGVLWIDWRHSAAAFAYSVYVDGVWTEPVILPWVSNSWLENEEVRQCIRHLVMK